ncbi:hypothetical protein GLOIN_2v454194 [Rhizophagus irregularis DAOM 181602=DAOM 197198]|uniref:Uncharacterized protein n=1 Tax=Rhizophagus irregularis (strain DAOM 181602 / DAOM 197198 / MUCL 43194) TaxID=747089 RepID=A0A2P4QPX1_RHIID|nr:hypothetical protein GLOIN_2v454194 [Rhizophagus irregularis DAOM 181602=DAOM 197198]POG79618.1 hypothetical protein GLOIN_2v454194 [Rhizophagus irregularis DAOM 181602=DAOM 197198]|eukprot:XP_025186484.1 hypothetical protein GLOIN_2v454194 [Rhizophagus irregularis DAOM 181602=DAOM 197198]
MSGLVRYKSIFIRLNFLKLYYQTMSTTFTTENTLEAENDWSLLGFLLYRQQCSDFLPNKSEEHHRYSLNLREIMGCEETPVHLLRRAGRAISSIQTEKKSQLIDEFWKSATSMQRRKIEAVAEREALLKWTDCAGKTYEKIRGYGPGSSKKGQ